MKFSTTTFNSENFMQKKNTLSIDQVNLCRRHCSHYVSEVAYNLTKRIEEKENMKCLQKMKELV